MTFKISADNVSWLDITPFIKFQGVKESFNGVDGPNAGRTMDALMHRDIIAEKLRYDVSLAPILRQDFLNIRDIIKNEYYYAEITYDDCDQISIECYSNNYSASYLIKKRQGVEYLTQITIPVIER